jgi:hypothetical protein
MTSTPSPAPSSLKGHRLSGFTGWQDRFFRSALGKHSNPVLHQIGRVAVDFHPGQAIAKDATMRQRPLCANAGAEIAEPALKSENLSQSFDVSPRQRQ